jgi:hypothetical protein
MRRDPSIRSDNQSFLKSPGFKSKFTDLDKKKDRKSTLLSIDSKFSNNEIQSPNRYLKIRNTSQSNQHKKERTTSMNKSRRIISDDEYDELSNIPCDEQFYDASGSPLNKNKGSKSLTHSFVK